MHSPIIKRWWNALSSSPSRDWVAAGELYRGPYWSTVLKLRDMAAQRGWRVKLWIASAGFGLVPASARVVSYSATFAPGHADSVQDTEPEGRHASNRKWWTAVSKKRLRGVAKRDLSRVSGIRRDAVVMVLGSPWYIGALADDLR
jgi:hypothetical protein